MQTDRFILRAAVTTTYLEAAFLAFDGALAGDDTGIASLGIAVQLGVHCLAADRFCLVKGAVLKVVGWKQTHYADRYHTFRRAKFMVEFDSLMALGAVGEPLSNLVHRALVTNSEAAM